MHEWTKKIIHNKPEYQLIELLGDLVASMDDDALRETLTGCLTDDLKGVLVFEWTEGRED